MTHGGFIPAGPSLGGLLMQSHYLSRDVFPLTPQPQGCDRCPVTSPEL